MVVSTPLTGEALLYSIDCALDDAAADGRIKPSGIDPDVRALFRRLHALGAPLHIPPRPPEPVQTVVLVMDRETRRRLARACHATPMMIWGVRLATYCGIPIKLDDDADGRVYLVSLRPMEEAG